MKENIKQRLVGSITLLVVVIGLLLLLHHYKKASTSPEQQALIPTTIDKPLLSTAPTQKVLTISTTKTKQSWVIHMISYSKKGFARSFIKQLRIHKYRAYIEQATVKNTTIYRVYVKAGYDWQKANELAKKLRKQFQLPQVIIQYEGK
ncbi:MAG: SPOR domain-containing protein [Gammaproteobacteria bacterium]|nr:SPOR domain-containing protein [Gammaproteobacteria bacterium]